MLVICPRDNHKQFRLDPYAGYNKGIWNEGLDPYAKESVQDRPKESPCVTLQIQFKTSYSILLYMPAMHLFTFLLCNKLLSDNHELLWLSQTQEDFCLLHAVSEGQKQIVLCPCCWVNKEMKYCSLSINKIRIRLSAPNGCGLGLPEADQLACLNCGSD